MIRTLLLLFLLQAVVANGQQLSSSSLYELYPVLHNPAAAGSNRHPVIGGNYRTQWSRMPSGPQTTVLFGSLYLPNIKVGLGGYLYNDVTGPTRRTGLQLAYAYHVAAGAGTFSAGIEVRGQQFAFDRARLQESLGALDPVLSGRSSRLKADAGLGFAYTTPRYQVGVSVSQLFQSRLNLYDGPATPSEEAKQYRHFYLHGHYNWQIDEHTLVVPSALFIYLPNAPLEAQGGIRVEHEKLLWYGLGLRARQGLMVSAGVHLTPRLSIGYSFDLYNSPLSVYKEGSSGHEALLRYAFLPQ